MNINNSNLIRVLAHEHKFETVRQLYTYISKHRMQMLGHITLSEIAVGFLRYVAELPSESVTPTLQKEAERLQRLLTPNLKAYVEI